MSNSLQKKAWLAISIDIAQLQNSPIETVRQGYKGVTSVAQAIQSNAPTLVTLKNAKSERFCLGLLELLLINMIESVGVENAMKKEVREECAEEILSQYYFFSLADVALIFKRAKCGRYGKFYNAVTMPQVMEWFEAYKHERANYFQLHQDGVGEVGSGERMMTSSRLNELIKKR